MLLFQHFTLYSGRKRNTRSMAASLAACWNEAESLRNEWPGTTNRDVVV